MKSSLRCLLAALLLGLFWTAAAQAGGVVYNKYNIHIFSNNRDIKASYANWTDPGHGHGIIAPNTPMKIEDWHRGFIIHTQTQPKKKVYFLYDEGRMNMSVADYLKAITAPSPVSLEGLTPKDLEGVSAGRAMVGMTKDGVLTAMGYPARHRTPSLQDREWTYWKNRFTTLVVVFDDAGVVTAIRQ